MKPGAYKWLLVSLLWVTALLNYVDRQVVFSVFPLLRSELQVSDVQLGLLGTAFLWVYGLLSPFGGYIADRYGRRNVILVSLGVWSAVTLLTGHARNYGELISARALMGISEACYLPAALAMIADHHSGRTRSLATGLHQSGLYAGIVLGGAGGGWMGDRYGWRATFFVLGVVGMVYAAVLAAGLRMGRAASGGAAAQAGIKASMDQLFASRAFLVVLGVNTLTSIAYWCVYTWMPTYLYERFHMSLTKAGFSATFYIQAASFAGILAGGWLADWWTRTNQRGRVLTQAIGLAAAGPFLFLTGWTGAEWVLVSACVVFGLGRGLFDCNLMPVVCQVTSLRATAYGVLNFTSCIAGGAMAAAGGALKSSIGLAGALEVSGLLLVAGAVWLMAIRLPERAPAEAE